MKIEETENLNWEFKKKLNFTQVLDKITDLTKEVVTREMKEIYSKIDVLHSMGIIKDEQKFRDLKEQLSKLNLEGKK